MSALVRTLIILAVFLVLAVANITNIIRHRKENKEAEEQRLKEAFPNAKKLKSKKTEEASEE